MPDLPSKLWIFSMSGNANLRSNYDDDFTQKVTYNLLEIIRFLCTTKCYYPTVEVWNDTKGRRSRLNKSKKMVTFSVLPSLDYSWLKIVKYQRIFEINEYFSLKTNPKLIFHWYKHVESEFFAIFPVEVTKTSFKTNCDHPNNYILSKQNLLNWFF